ncbi:MAG: hypothetical protein IPK75_20630 [Acidobacteria bacterium]|nr:hypothetical protein [Acidobacteriota bacterium]
MGRSRIATVRQRLEKYPGEKVTILHSVHPRWEVPGASRTRMPWASVYIEEDTKHLLDEGGFIEFPFVVPRWDRSGCSAYGWSPGMTVLDEVIRVNAMGRTNLKAGQYTAEPEVYVPDGMFRRGLSQARRPGAVHSYSTNVAAANAEVRKWPSAEGLPFLLEYEHDRRNAIREAYFYFSSAARVAEHDGNRMDRAPAADGAAHGRTGGAARARDGRAGRQAVLRAADPRGRYRAAARGIIRRLRR